MRSTRARTSGSGRLIAIGIAIAICLPVAAVIAAVTLVGLPLAIGILLALLPLGARRLPRLGLGARPPDREAAAPPDPLLPRRPGDPAAPLALVPILGALVGLAAVVFGLGLIGAAIGAAREPADPAAGSKPGQLSTGSRG